MTNKQQRDELGRFPKGVSGNPKGGNVNAGLMKAREQIREALPGIIKKLIAQAMGGDTVAAKLLIERVLAPLRAESAAVLVPKLKDAGTLPEKAAVIVDAVADGAISSDVGERLLAALAHAGQIIELDRLAREVEELKTRSLI